MAQTHAFCTLCESKSVRAGLAFWGQPLSNRFIDQAQNDIPPVDIQLGLCVSCGVIQLATLPNIDDVRPIYNWLTYNEPEGHLDNVVEHLMPLLSQDANIIGATYKDETTLRRLSEKGFSKTEVIDYKQLKMPYGLETIQYALSDKVEALYADMPEKSADLLIARHIIEHAHRAKVMLSNLSSLVKDGGLLVLEFPESSALLNKKNYPFLWEEHISYFTEDDCQTLADAINAELIGQYRYPYAYEDSMVIVLRINHTPNKGEKAVQSANVSKKSCLLNEFEQSFNTEKQRWQDRLAAVNAQGKKVTVFGAGHLSIKFINFFELGEYIDCVVDDNTNKVGSYMPGSHVPIVASESVSADSHPYCISTLSPESKKRVLQLNDYLKSGVELIDAFNSRDDVL
ncbi:methyltransferase domain-containing protein [Alteromonadaceae bacterium M269]|nr:methyltransferase domain-containing protein [Alteromonadaceae bacterium M269]